MARRGFGGTALRAALGAVTGVAEGLQQRDVVADEKKRMADVVARQNMLDTVSLLNSGYDPEGFSMDAPGATPRPVFDTQMVGTRKFTRSMSPGQMKHMEAVQTERAENRSKRLDASLKPAATLPLRYTEGKTGINVFNPNTGESTNQSYAKGFTPKEPAAGDDTDKARTAGITKVIAGAGRVLDAAREEAKAAQTQLDRLDSKKPDETRMTTEDFDKAIAAWQVKVDAAEKRFDDAQAKVGRMGPAYNLAATTNDTTGIGEAYRDRPPAPPSTRSFDLFSPASGGAGKEKMREDLWDSIKLQNPTLSDSAITARVKKEIP